MSRSNFRSPEGERAVMALYDRVLERWPLPLERRTVPTRHGDTFVLEFGVREAATLVLLHGAGTNSSMWAGDAAHYGARFHVFAIDLPGEAGRSTPARPPWKGLAFAEWLLDAFDVLGLARANLAGLSQGGWAALKFAVVSPERVSRLALIAPAGVVPESAGFVLRALVYSRMGEWGRARIMRLVFSPGPVPDGALAGTSSIARHFRARVGILPRFADSELRRLTMPTLLIGGDRDALRDTAAIRHRLAGAAPHLEARTIVGGGHVLADTAPIVMEFLAREES